MYTVASASVMRCLSFAYTENRNTTEFMPFVSTCPEGYGARKERCDPYESFALGKPYCCKTSFFNT